MNGQLSFSMRRTIISLQQPSHGLASLILPGTFHAAGHAPLVQARVLSSKVATGDSDSIMSALGIKMYPDLADANQRELAKSFSSMGKVLSLYRKPRSRAEHGLLPELEDWSYYLWNRFDTLRVCKLSILGFSRANFLAHACNTYQVVHAATSTGNPQLLERLKELAVPRMYEQLKADAYWLQQQQRGAAAKGRHRARSGTDAKPSGHPQWQLVEITSAEIVDAADACPVPEDLLKQIATQLHCAQLTVRFVTQQRLQEEGYKTQQRSKDSKVHTFEDYWVFERPLYKSWLFRKAGPWGANWRLLAQLDVPEMSLTATAAEREQATAAARGRVEKFGLGVLMFGVLNLIGYGLYSVIFT
ncbi:hypothetical protein DUNSADRAFT_2042 [Dunaliella salina]|uniref:Tim44-like domain-containing protein n=1 Tax=Dunaliella salina TaxID=3046 RepID=A0ABQ7GW85_DUNSA|nr:hypothetical protein DUNSADRAFT_2042 [Dunaliella salina]|eukprot:KAF5838873.1 hypothetical protein DUNSADRAFT_2042 [Dunaliella salina]